MLVWEGLFQCGYLQKPWVQWKHYQNGWVYFSTIRYQNHHFYETIIDMCLTSFNQSRQMFVMTQK